MTRLFYLQVVHRSHFIALAKEQHSIALELEPKRGIVFDREMRVLALNLNVDSVYANPREVTNVRATSQRLSQALSLREDFVYGRLRREKGFVWIKRKITGEESDAVKKLKLPGIMLIQESKRFYPNGSLGCHLIGVAGVDNVGLDGAELVCDSYLRGSAGWLRSLRDGKSRRLLSFQDEYVAPRNGHNVVLTIDEVIQHIAERELQKAFEGYRAKGASIIVMDPRNGDVLAMANLPNYDLNQFHFATADSVRNRAISDVFEPGSIFKVVTASAALEEGAVDFNKVFFCENGKYTVGKRTLRDHRPHGNLTFREVIEKSSNIGTVKVAALVGDRKLFQYMQKFGFYGETGIELPGEAPVISRDVSQWTKGSMLAIPMGQEVAVTAIQLACAISAIANGGTLYKPRIIKEIVDEQGVVVEEFETTKVRTAISEETSIKMKRLLTGVIERGTGQQAKIDGVVAAGKTGTAQKIEPNGGYSHTKFIASFIGFAPAGNPLVSIVVTVDEPMRQYYGGVVSAPVFRNVAKEVLQYLEAKRG